ILSNLFHYPVRALKSETGTRARDAGAERRGGIGRRWFQRWPGHPEIIPSRDGPVPEPAQRRSRGPVPLAQIFYGPGAGCFFETINSAISHWIYAGKIE